MPRPPINPVVVTPHGGYGYERSDASEGACGVHDYPCTHWGLDCAGSVGDTVVAPCDAWVLASFATNTPPFTGYGPSVVLLAHDDGDDRRGVLSFRYSLLAHLEPRSLRYSIDPDRDFLASHASANYDILADGTYAAKRLKAGSTMVHVSEGEELGYIGAAHHVHWEVRISPLGSGGVGTMDPLGWLAGQDVHPTTTQRKETSWAPLALFAALVWWSDSRNSNRRR